MSEQENGTRVKRTCYFDDEMWESARRAAAVITARTSREVSISDLIRWGLHRQLKAVAQGNFDKPKGA